MMRHGLFLGCLRTYLDGHWYTSHADTIRPGIGRVLIPARGPRYLRLILYPITNFLGQNLLAGLQGSPQRME